MRRIAHETRYTSLMGKFRRLGIYPKVFTRNNAKLASGFARGLSDAAGGIGEVEPDFDAAEVRALRANGCGDACAKMASRAGPAPRIPTQLGLGNSRRKVFCAVRAVTRPPERVHQDSNLPSVRSCLYHNPWAARPTKVNSTVCVAPFSTTISLSFTMGRFTVDFTGPSRGLARRMNGEPRGV